MVEKEDNFSRCTEHCEPDNTVSSALVVGTSQDTELFEQEKETKQVGSPCES